MPSSTGCCTSRTAPSTLTRAIIRSATKSRQAQSRLKMLERMERIVPAHVDSPFEFEFAAPLKTPRPLLTVEDAVCGYAQLRGLAGMHLPIGPLDRGALLAPS